MSSAKRTSYFYSILGTALVLFAVGLAGLLVLKARDKSKEFKENLAAEIVLKDNVPASRIPSLQTAIKGKSYVKNIRFISKEEALTILKAHLGNVDYLDSLDTNPLFNSFLINLYENYTSDTGVASVRGDLLTMPEIERVDFQVNEMQSLNTHVTNISFIILIIAALLLVFAVSLIFNTIRLAMYSSRFTIKTMQLFGATRWFIIKPFLGRSLLNGLASGALAVLLLSGLLFYLNYKIPALALLSDLITFAVLFGALIVFGIIITFFSTLIAVFRYLSKKVEDLY